MTREREDKKQNDDFARIIKSPFFNNDLMRILIVDDEKTSRVIIKEIFLNIAECTLAENGVEGVEAYKKAAEEGKHFHIVLMDVIMPGMDGNEAIRQIREYDEMHIQDESKRAKKIMISSSREALSAFQTKCDAYIMKPVSRDRVFSKIAKVYHELLN